VPPKGGEAATVTCRIHAYGSPQLPYCNSGCCINRSHTADAAGSHTADGTGSHTADGAGSHTADGDALRRADGAGSHTADGDALRRADGAQPSLHLDESVRARNVYNMALWPS
jgi:hypothetical protein